MSNYREDPGVNLGHWTSEGGAAKEELAKGPEKLSRELRADQASLGSRSQAKEMFQGGAVINCVKYFYIP